MGASLTHVSGTGWIKDKLDELLKTFLQWHHTYVADDVYYYVTECEYRMALHFAGILFEQRDFYRLPHSLLFRFINDIGSLTVSEAIKVTHNFVRCGTSCEEGASMQLARFLTKMKVRISETAAVSPSVDPDVYRKIVGHGFETQWQEELWKPELFNFSEPQRQEERERQLAEDMTLSFDIPHDEFAALATYGNVSGFQNAKWSKLELSKWTRWRPTVWVFPPTFHEDPATNPWGLWNAIDDQLPDWFTYLLSLMPELMCLPLPCGETIPTQIIRLALPKWQEHALMENLHKLGCNFNLPNNKGKRPLEVAKRGSTIDLLMSYGFNVNVRNDKGDSSLELNSVSFDEDVLHMLLENGADVLDPHPKTGAFWIPFVLKNKYYGSLGPDGFQYMVRKIMRHNTRAPYCDNAICQEIIKRAIEDWAFRDSMDLLNAVAKDNFERARILVALGAPTGRTNLDGKSCLVMCAETGNLKMAKLLIENFADVNTLNRQGENCFRIACLHGHFDLAKVFVEQKVDVDAKAVDAMNTLHLAYNQGNEALMNFCLEQGCSPNIRDQDGLSVQFRAFLERKDELAEKIQKHYNGDINLQDGQKNTLAHLACNANDLERVRYLHQRGIDLQLKNNKGLTVFLEAVMRKNIELCQVLVDLGCDVNVPMPDGQSVIMYAYGINDMPLFHFLLEKKCDPNAKTPDEGSTLLMMALDKKDFDACDALLAHGANINARDKRGQTPLLRCVSHSCDRATFDYLIRKGCSVNGTDTFQCCALSYLIKSDRREEASIVLQKGNVEVNYPSAGEEEPIAIALQAGSKYWFDELLKHGANAMNEKWPVTENYMRQPWFSLDGLRELGECNLGVGSPIPYAMEEGMYDVLDQLWYSASAKMQKAATHTRGSYGRTPLMIAIHMNLDNWVSVLLKERFQCEGTDREGATPIIYAVRAENRDWTEQLYDIVGPKGAQKEDRDGCSALTCADDNGWNDLCKAWFCDDIRLPPILGRCNIIKGFYNKLRDIQDATKSAQRLLDQSKAKLKDYQQKLKSKKQELDREQKAAKDYVRPGAQALTKDRQNRMNQRLRNASKIQGEVRKREEAVAVARKAVSYYEGVLSELKRLSRRDILSNIEPLMRKAEDKRPFMDAVRA